MAENLWPYILGALATIVVGFFVYLATRKRDAPSLEIQKKVAADEGAKAASEAWAELASALQHRVERAEERLEECEMREEKLGRDLTEARDLIHDLRRKV